MLEWLAEVARRQAESKQIQVNQTKTGGIWVTAFTRR